jgi:hypothetical protein
MNASATTHSLPAEFIQKPAAGTLKFHNRKKLPLHHLPFIDRAPGKVGLSFWAVPKTGGYFGGCKTGESLARLYLKHLKEHGVGFAGGNLQTIVLDMFDIDNGISPEQDALRGQAVGFFIELERWLVGATKYLDGGLDQHDKKALLKEANAGLSFDHEAYMASLSDEDEEE